MNDINVENPPTLLHESTESLDDDLLKEYEKYETPKKKKKKRHENPHTNRHGTSIPAIYLLFLKANLGVGILSLPKAISNSGILAGTLVIIALGILLAFCSYTLTDLSEFAKERISTSQKLKKLKTLVPKNVKKAKRKIFHALLDSFEKYFSITSKASENEWETGDVPPKFIPDIEVGESSRTSMAAKSVAESEIGESAREAGNIPPKFVEDIETGESSGVMCRTSTENNSEDEKTSTGSEGDADLNEFLHQIFNQFLSLNKSTSEKQLAKRSSDAEESAASDSELTESEKQWFLNFKKEFVNTLESGSELRSVVEGYYALKEHLKELFVCYSEETPFMSPLVAQESHYSQEIKKFSQAINGVLKDVLEKQVDAHFRAWEFNSFNFIPNEKMKNKELQLFLLTTFNKFLDNFNNPFEEDASVKEYCEKIVKEEQRNISKTGENFSALQLMLKKDAESSDDDDTKDEPLIIDYHATIKTTLKYSTDSDYWKAGWRTILMSLIFTLHFFACCTSFIFVADTLKEVGICGRRFENGTSFELVAYAVPFVLSLIMVSESGDDLTAVVFIACALQVVGLVMLLAHFVTGDHSKKLIPYAAPFDQWPLFLSSVFYAYEGTGTFFDLQGRIQDRETSRHHYNVSMCLIVPLYILVSVLGYWKYGEDAMYNITFNLPESSFTNMIQVLTALSILLAYPFHMSHLLQITKNLVMFHKLPCRDKCKRHFDTGLRVTLFGSTFLFTLYIPDLEVQLLLSGGVFVALLIIIAPQLLYLSVWQSITHGKAKSYWRIVISVIVIIVTFAYLIWSGVKLRQLFPQFYYNYTWFG